jgi:hypothetical protein
MNFEDVGRVWREQGTGDFQRRKIENLSTAQGRADRFLGRLHRRGMVTFAITFLGLAAAVVAGIADWGRPWLAWPGLIILVATLLRALFRLQALRSPHADTTPPVRHAVQAAVDRLRLLEQFWNRAALHFYLPFLVGEILTFEGFRRIGAERCVMNDGFYVFLILIVVFGSLENRRAARRNVRPLREDLESWLADLESFDHDGSSGAEPTGA